MNRVARLALIGAIAGVVQSGLLTAEVDQTFDFSKILPDFLATNHTWWPMLPFVVMAFWLYWVGAKSKK